MKFAACLFTLVVAASAPLTALGAEHNVLVTRGDKVVIVLPPEDDVVLHPDCQIRVTRVWVDGHRVVRRKLVCDI